MTDANRPPVPWDVPAPANPAVDAAPATAATRSTPRAVRAVVWVVGIGFLLFLSRIAWILSQRSEPDPSTSAAYGTSFVVGGALGAFLAAVVLRWLYVRARRRRTPVLSPWLIGIASVWLLLAIGGYASKPVAAADPGAAALRVAERLQIAAPYRLGPADDEAKRALFDPIVAQGARAGLRAGEIRAILDGPDTVGYLVVLDVNITSGDVEDYVTGFLGGATRQGGTGRRDEIAGQALAIVSGPDATLVGWAEAPLVITLVGFDETSAVEMSKATLSTR